MDSDLTSLRDHIVDALGASLVDAKIVLSELVLRAKREDIIETLAFLQSDPLCRFTTLIDICGVDYPSREKRFDVVYHLLSMQLNHRIRVKIAANEDAAVPSAVSLYPSAGWYEREAFDMFGIAFEGNPDLRRILTDYGFEGHPLRKDFPLSGFVEVRYDEERKKVVYDDVNLPQEFRDFDFLSPWEGAKYVMDDVKDGGENG